MTAYKSQMTAQFMGYCYKTNFSNEFPKHSVVGLSLEEFTFKPLSPSFKSADRKLQKLFHITPNLTRGKKKKKKEIYLLKLGISFLRQHKSHGADT